MKFLLGGVISHGPRLFPLTRWLVFSYNVTFTTPPARRKVADSSLNSTVVPSDRSLLPWCFTTARPTHVFAADFFRRSGAVGRTFLSAGELRQWHHHRRRLDCLVSTSPWNRPMNSRRRNTFGFLAWSSWSRRLRGRRPLRSPGST